MEPGTQDLPPVGNERLQQLFIKLLKIFGVLVVAFLIIYTFGQRTNHATAPSTNDAAVTTAEAAVRANPNNVDSRIALADAYLKVGRQDDALGQLNELLKADGKNLSALMGAASIYYDKGEFDSAKKDLLTYVSIAKVGEFASGDSQLERAYFMLGDIAETQKDYASAAALFANAVGVKSTDADAWFRLGRMRNEIKDYKGAAEAFSRALAFVPEGWCDPYAGLKDAYTGAKNAEGEKYASSMVDICGGAGLSAAAPLESLTKGTFKLQAFLGLGLAAEHDKAYAKALSYYKQATAIDPANIIAVNAITRINTIAPTPSA